MSPVRPGGPPGEAEVVVIGAGAAGCALAARLAAVSDLDVLVLEAGTRSHDPFLSVPKGFVRTMRSRRLTWTYPLDTEVWLRGRTLGGSTAINGSLHLRGEPALYDELAGQLGAGWRWDAWRDAFDAVEAAGVPVTATPSDATVGPAVLAALTALGVPTVGRLDEVAGARAGELPASIRHGRKVNAYRALLAPALRSGGVRLMAGAHAASVVIERGRAVGVALADGGIVRARRAVVSCAGTIETPLLLERSGIGPARVLAAAGISVQVDAPAVGEGLREHRTVPVKARLSPGLGLGPRLRGVRAIAREAVRYAVTRSGPLATPPYEIGALIDMDGSPSQLLATALATDDTGLAVADYDGLMIQGYAISPRGSGSVHIAGADPGTPPVIRPPRLDAPAAGALLDTIREVLATEPLAGLVVEEVAPGPGVAGAEAAGWMRDAGSGVYHAVGTCAAGPDDSAVVDLALRVRGVDGLFVADLSVLPSQTSGAMAAPAMALGHLAADFVTKFPG